MKDMQVVVGGLSLNTKESTEQTLKVEEAIVHENYRESPAAVYNDIGKSVSLICYEISNGYNYLNPFSMFS